MAINNNIGLPRRKFLDYFLGGGLATVLLAMLAPVGAYLWPARKRGGAQDVIDAGTTKDWPEATAKNFQVGGHPFAVIRVSESEFKAYSLACPHLGCIVQWDAPNRTFKCPCHAGVFSQDGKVVSGPPPGPLLAYEVMVVGDLVKVKVPPV